VVVFTNGLVALTPELGYAGTERVIMEQVKGLLLRGRKVILYAADGSYFPNDIAGFDGLEIVHTGPAGLTQGRNLDDHQRFEAKVSEFIWRDLLKRKDLSTVDVVHMHSAIALVVGAHTLGAKRWTTFPPRKILQIHNTPEQERNFSIPVDWWGKGRDFTTFLNPDNDVMVGVSASHAATLASPSGKTVPLTFAFNGKGNSTDDLSPDKLSIFNNAPESTTPDAAMGTPATLASHRQSILRTQFELTDRELPPVSYEPLLPGEYFVMVGRIDRVKGVKQAILAVRQYNRTYGTKMKLVIAGPKGTASGADYFRKEILPLLGEDVVILGVVGAGKGALVANAAAAIYPHDWLEPFGLVHLEAMWEGVPIVTSPLGATKEFSTHGKTAWIVPADQWGNESDRIVSLVEGLRWAANRTKAQRTAIAKLTRQRVSVSEMMNRVTKLYAHGPHILLPPATGADTGAPWRVRTTDRVKLERVRPVVRVRKAGGWPKRRLAGSTLVTGSDLQPHGNGAAALRRTSRRPVGRLVPR
jgi:glycosyltransferase involved in cell wall biosynthesis